MEYKFWILSIIFTCIHINLSMQQDQQNPYKSLLIYASSYGDMLNKVQKNPNHLSSLLITTSAKECNQCKQALVVYEDFSYNVEQVIKTFVIDCQSIQYDEQELSEIPACKVDNFELLPAITFLSPPKKETFNTISSKTPVENRFQGALSLSSLFEAVEILAPKYSQQIEDIEYFDQVFLKDITLHTKVILLKPDNKIPLWWRGLTSEFKDIIQFGEADSDEPQFRKRFQMVGQYPYLLILNYDSSNKRYIQQTYEQDKNYNKITRFLRDCLLTNNQSIKPTQYMENLQNKDKIEEIQYHQIQQLLEIQYQWVMIHIRYNDQKHPRFSQLHKKLAKLVKIVEIRCNQTQCRDQIKRTFKLQEIPAILIFPFQHKTMKNAIIVGSKDNYQSISEFMLDSIVSQTQTFKDVDYSLLLEILKKARDEQLYPVLWFYDSQDYYWSLVAATLSSLPEYSKHLKFLFSKDPNEDQRQQWQIETLPKIMTFKVINLESGDHQKFDFENSLTVSNIQSYLNEVQFSTLYEVAQNNEETKIVPPVQMVDQQSDLETLCLNLDRYCAVFFLDTMKESKLKQDLQTLSELRNVHKDMDISWIWIDGRCHDQTMKSFRLDSDTLSSMIIYDPINIKFATFREEFTLKNMIRFLDKALNHKQKKLFKYYDDEFLIQSLNCDLIRENLKRDYQNEKKQIHQLFIQTQRQNDRENAKIKRIQEQKNLLDDL